MRINNSSARGVKSGNGGFQLRFHFQNLPFFLKDSCVEDTVNFGLSVLELHEGLDLLRAGCRNEFSAFPIENAVILMAIVMHPLLCCHFDGNSHASFAFPSTQTFICFNTSAKNRFGSRLGPFPKISVWGLNTVHFARFGLSFQSDWY